MTPDQERWAEAIAIQRLHGDDAPRWLAARLSKLALDDDVLGIERFQAIATRLECLLSSSSQ